MSSVTALEDFKLARKPFPLHMYLLIVERANETAFSCYCEGAKVLHDWLTNKGEVPLTLPDVSHIGKIPRTATGYDSYQIAKIIAGEAEKTPSFVDYMNKLMLIEKAIYYCMMITVVSTFPSPVAGEYPDAS